MNLRLNIKKPLGGKIYSSNLWVWLTYILFIAFVICIVSTFLDYGITYDEDFQTSYGEKIIRWYSSFFQDQGALTYGNEINYGGFFVVIGQLVAKISPMGVYETRHLLNAFFGLLGVIGAYKLGKYLGGPLAGFLSALFLILTPSYYGHSFNNSKDIPMATLSIFSLYYLIRSIHYLPHPPRGLLVKLGVVLGLTLAVRVGAVILVGYVGIAFCLWFFGHYWLRKESARVDKDLRATFFRLVESLFGICVIAYLVMLIWWPAALVRPVVQPVKSLLLSAHFSYPIRVFFEGKTILSTNLPWYYVPKWFLISLPEFYFIALACGLMLIGLTVWKFWKDSNISNIIDNGSIEILILLISIFLPIFHSTFMKAPVYDGIRHYLFIIPPMVVLAALSLSKLRERITLFSTLAIMIAVFVSLVITVIDMVELHPHQYIYFNRLFGKGVAEAAKSYETDYWGNSYKEGVEYIVKNYKNPNEGRKVKVASCLHSLSTSYFLPEDRFEYVGTFHHGRTISDEAEIDVFLATPRWGCYSQEKREFFSLSKHRKPNGRVLHTIGRKGAPLLYIIEVFKDSPQEKEIPLQ